MLGDDDDATDAVQDAFVKAYRSLAQLQQGHSFGPWFRSILRNRCIDILRSPARRDRVSLDDVTFAQRSWTQPVGTVALEREQHAAAVTAALAQLTPEHRQILVLKEIEEMSYAEIASAMSIPPGTVASRLHFARHALRKVVESAGIELNGASP
jgi:RNA polymerase sigma-70 factor (ECF subfamily)